MEPLGRGTKEVTEEMTINACDEQAGKAGGWGQAGLWQSSTQAAGGQAEAPLGLSSGARSLDLDACAWYCTAGWLGLSCSQKEPQRDARVCHLGFPDPRLHPPA